MTALEFENFEPENTPEESISGDQKYIDYSVKMVSYLEAKTEEHNNDEEKKYVNTSQLKRVFINAAKNFYKTDSGLEIHEWSVARVNMFLAIKAGRKINYNTEDVRVKDLLDASSVIVPSNEDIEQAKKDIKAHDLGLNFESIENLYIEDEKNTIEFDWE